MQEKNYGLMSRRDVIKELHPGKDKLPFWERVLESKRSFGNIISRLRRSAESRDARKKTPTLKWGETWNLATTGDQHRAWRKSGRVGVPTDYLT